MMRTIVTTALLLSGCLAPERSGAFAVPITNGAEVPAGGDPAVVALLAGGSPSCTATLISDRIAITAAHCVAAPPSAGWSVFFGNAVDGDGTVIPVLDARPAPDFEPLTLLHDVGVVLLESPAPEGVAPVALLDAAFDDTFIGREVRLVGFGRTERQDDEPRRKREGQAIISDHDQTSFTFDPAPSSTCYGDSGGPAFLLVDGIERLAGVTSRGGTECGGPATDTRVDAHLASFLAPYLEWAGPGGAVPGERCVEPAQCAQGDCVPAIDEPRLSFCSPPCAAADDCPAGMSCEGEAGGGLCRWPTPTPGALGGPCERAADCLSAKCASSGAASICTVSCFVEAPESCPEEMECRMDDQPLPEPACFPAGPDGGCSAAGGRPSLIAWLLVLLSARRRGARRCPSRPCAGPRPGAPAPAGGGGSAPRR